MSKFIKILIGFIVVVALALSGAQAIKNAKQKDAAMPKAKIYPIVSKVYAPTLKKVKLTLPFLATVKNDKDVKLSSRIAARILKIVPSGTSIKRGDVIIKLDTTNIESNLANIKEQLKASNIALDNLQATHNRTLDLLKIQGASIEVSQREVTKIASTQAKINGLIQKSIELKNNLSYATIASPVDGVIAKTFENKGAVSMLGKALISISSKNGFYLMVRVPTSLHIKAVEFNNKIYSATALGSTYHGLAEYKVFIGSENVTTGDRIEVNVIVFNDVGNLLPFDAFLDRDGKSFVLIANENSASAKEVHIIASAQEGVVISEPLIDKKIVLAKPDILLKLTSGYALKVKE